MRFCFILEQTTASAPLPLAVADQLERWGHTVGMLTLESLPNELETFSLAQWDAYIVRMTSVRMSQTEGIGAQAIISLLQAAEALNIPTMNNSRAWRLLRDHDALVAMCASHSIAVVPYQGITPYANLSTLPYDWYPLLITPIDRTSETDSFWIEDRESLATAKLEEDGIYLVRGPVMQPGMLVRLTVAGQEVRAFRLIGSEMPPHGEILVSQDMLNLSQRVGEACGLDFFCLDVMVRDNTLTLLCVQDFPNFARIPHAVISIAEYILHAGYHHSVLREQNESPETGPLCRQEATLVPAAQARRYENVAHLL